MPKPAITHKYTNKKILPDVISTPVKLNYLPMKLGCLSVMNIEICSGLNANEIQIPYDKHHKVSSLVKSYQNTHNSVKYEVLIKQYLRSILDISVNISNKNAKND